MTMSSVIRLAAAMSGVIALTATAAESAPSAARGKQTFMRVGCYTCHGTEGQGSGSGTKLAPDPLPAEALAQFLRNAAGFMPSYGETILPDSEVADIAAYLQTIKPSPSPDRIPILRDLKLPP